MLAVKNTRFEITRFLPLSDLNPKDLACMECLRERMSSLNPLL
jgi:hypothetical protein